jgi:hypothetical protein
VQHPQAARGGLDELGVAGADRARHDQRVRVAKLAGRVADVNPRTERGKLGERGGGGAVTAGDADTAGNHDPRDPRHARATDAREMHPPELLERHRLGWRHQRHRASPP